MGLQDLDELAEVVLQGIRDEKFIIMIGVESVGTSLRARADFLRQG